MVLGKKSLRRTKNAEVPVEAVFELYSREMPDWKWEISGRSKKSAVFMIEGKKGIKRLLIVRSKKGVFTITNSYSLVAELLTFFLVGLFDEFFPPKHLRKAWAVAHEYLDLENYDEEALGVR